MPKAPQYLLIQNKGEAPVEGYTVLGFSSTQGCGVEGTIGQFGSGAKHAINLALRSDLPVWVYCGKTRVEFSLEREVIADGTVDEYGDPTETTVYHVLYKIGDRKTQRAGWVLDFGVLDWDDIGMGLRELISNAIDRTLRDFSSVKDAQEFGDLSIKIVDDSERRAKAGYTRVYIALNDAVREYYGNLGKNFLHFSDHPELAKPCLIKKENNTGVTRIYREGVWVRDIEEESVFDYNFSADEIKIDECRNSSDWAVKAACARRLRISEPVEMAHVLKAQVLQLPGLESNLDSDYVTGWGSLSDKQSHNLKEAWAVTAGPETVVCENNFSKDYVEKKGHAAKVVGPSWVKTLKAAGVKTADDVLTVSEQRGRTRVDTTQDAQTSVNWAWDLVELAGLTGEREKPPVFCYQETMEAESMVFGFCDGEGVHLHEDISDGGQSTELKKTALEEVAHWVTGATDNSRDFQQFFIDALVKLA